MRRALILLNLAYAFCLVVLALVPRVPSIPGVHVQDLAAHAAAYGLQAGLLFGLLGFFPTFQAALFSLAGATGFGILTEILQLLTPRRHFEFADMLADFLGALVVVLLCSTLHLLRRRRKA